MLWTLVSAWVFDASYNFRYATFGTACLIFLQFLNDYSIGVLYRYEIRSPSKGPISMSDLSIKLEGFPEKIQRITDVLEEAFPGMMVWFQSEDSTDGILIKIEGLENPMMPMQAWQPIAA